jgi:glycosyltransferase involved in cell wall biosynthesis
VPGKEILVGDNARELADHVIVLLTDQKQSKALAENSFRFVHDNYSWEKSTAKLADLMMSTKVKEV